MANELYSDGYNEYDNPFEDQFNLQGTYGQQIDQQSYLSDSDQRYLTPYNGIEFTNEVYGMDFERLRQILMYKMNIILQGAPGVGKTYAAKRLAYAIIGQKDESRVVQVQFHQQYTYEDFIMGLKPTEQGGFKFESGPFYNICKKAESDPERKPYFIIIDEINRANMSKVLGEAFQLIEKDHRNEKATLKYNSELFSVPDNLYIIGTMNTADRGLVMLDYALRRRFQFITIEPAFKSNGFKNMLLRINNQKLNKVCRKIMELNDDICKDEMLGPGFMVGHSYFCVHGDHITDTDVENIVRYEIEPLLDEYWYDNPDKMRRWKQTFETLIR